MRPKSKIVVSVIMPAHNVESYIEEAIQSVLDQRGVTYELLIVDDASTDQTWDCIRSFQKDPRVRAWRLRKRRGFGAASNYLFARARGAYLSSCDADDKLLPGCLRTLVRALDRNPGVGVVYSDRLVRDRSGRLRPDRRSRGPAETWDLIEGPVSNVGTLMRRGLIRKVGGYRTDLPYLPDYDLFWRLAEATRFLYLKGRPLYFYRKRPDSLTNQYKRKRSTIQLSLLRDVISRRYGFQSKW